MHLSTAHSSRYYSAQPETGDAIQPAMHPLVRREQWGYSSSPSWTTIFIAAGASAAGAIVLGFTLQFIHSRVKRSKNNKPEGEQQQRWYGR